MKQLLKHYQEVSKKADPDNWRSIAGDGKPVSNGVVDPKPFYTSGRIDKEAMKHQLEKLQIEDALYGHWERNILVSIKDEDGNIVSAPTKGKEEQYKKLFTIAQARFSNPNKGLWFNEWLQDELNKLED